MSSMPKGCARAPGGSQVAVYSPSASRGRRARWRCQVSQHLRLRALGMLHLWRVPREPSGTQPPSREQPPVPLSAPAWYPTGCTSWVRSECVGSGPFLTTLPHLLRNPGCPSGPRARRGPGAPGLPEFACAPFLAGPQVVLADRLLWIPPHAPHVTHGCCSLSCGRRSPSWLKGARLGSPQLELSPRLPVRQTQFSGQLLCGCYGSQTRAQALPAPGPGP